MKYTYKELLGALESCKADYGGNVLEFPCDCPQDIEELTEEQAQEVFDMNGGDIAGMEEYMEMEE